MITIALIFVYNIVRTDSAQIDHPKAQLTIERDVKATEHPCLVTIGALGLGAPDNTDLCKYLQARVGQRVRITIVPLGASKP